jgi:hypothetical protein
MLVGHEGDCLGRISEKRAKFYLKKDLAFDWTNQVITSKENDDTKFIKLKFTENGLGKNGQKFFMTKRENKCVVCGETESLHKTYIVPKEFRDHMPESYKLHNDYVNLIATNGLVGFAVYYILFIPYCGYLFIKRLKEYPNAPSNYLLIGLMSGLLVYLGQVMFNFGVVATRVLFYELLGLAMAIIFNNPFNDKHEA